jgi:hypothetical protein
METAPRSVAAIRRLVPRWIKTVVAPLRGAEYFPALRGLKPTSTIVRPLRGEDVTNHVSNSLTRVVDLKKG